VIAYQEPMLTPVGRGGTVRGRRPLCRWIAAGLTALSLLGTGSTEAGVAPTRATLTRACAAGSGADCYALALVLLDTAIDSSAQSNAAALLASSCELGHGPACSRLGQAYESGEGVRRLPAAARSLYALACCLGDSTGCDEARRLDAPISSGEVRHGGESAAPGRQSLSGPRRAAG